MSEDKTFMAACGANISKAHFYRNTSKELLTGLLAKDKSLNDEGKALRLFMAREALTKALMTTAEGQALLQNVEAQIVTGDFLDAVEVAIDAEAGIGTPTDFNAKVEELSAI